jgi:outer membrane protein TolC
MRWPCFALFLSFTSHLAGAAEELLSLDEAVQLAIERAPQVAGKAAASDAAQSVATSSGRLPDPQLVLALDNLPVSGPDAWSTSSDFMTMRKIGVMQEFPRAGERRLQRERAEAEASLAAAELLQTRVDIARDVAQAWIRRSTAESSLVELTALRPEVELQAAAARAAVAAGRSSSAEALAAEAALAQLANRIFRLQSEARRAALELTRWIDADAARPLAAMPALEELPAPADALLASVDEHVALLPYESRTAVAQLDVELAKVERRPDWSTEIVYSKRGPDFSDMVSLEFRVGLPLFAKNRQNPVIGARSAELRALQAERDAELRMHAAEMRQVLSDWELLGKQLRLYETELSPLARERSRAVLAAYRAGRGDLRLAVDALIQEIELVIERTELENEYGRAWAYLRYLEPRHVGH